MRGGRGFLLAAAVMLAAACGDGDDDRGSDRPGSQRPTGAASGPAARLRDRSIRPGEGIGPVSLGDTRQEAERALGRGEPTGSAEQVSWTLGGGRLEARFDVNGRVVEVSTGSDAFDLAGTRLSEGYRGVAAALRGTWKAVDCGGFKSVVSNRGPNGPGTSWNFSRQGNSVVVQGQGPVPTECVGD
jgi:hypothetical protein